jgi:hypothetical protein
MESTENADLWNDEKVFRVFEYGLVGSTFEHRT